MLEPGRSVFSFAQVGHFLRELAVVLESAGVSMSKTVAIALPSGAGALVSVLGTARFCTVAMLNPALTVAELEADLLELGVIAVLLEPSNYTAASVAQRLGVAVIEATWTKEACDWRVLFHPDRDIAPPEDTAARNPAKILLHTSATTGRRKIVPITAQNLQAMLWNTATVLELGSKDRLLCMAKLFHTQGILSPLAQLMAGGSVIMAPDFSPESFSMWIEELMPTWYTCGPTFHRAILAHVKDHPLAPRCSLRFIRSGGSFLSRELQLELEANIKVPVLNVYGLTETGAVACTQMGLVDHNVQMDFGAVGKTMGPKVTIMSPEGALVEQDQEGEIVVSGPSVIAGYLNDPAANREAFRGEWFRTGDLGRLDRNGLLYVSGRLKEIINRGGQKIIPEEIDAVLLRHRAIKDAAAFGIPHATLGEDIMCAVVLHALAKVEELELRTYIANALTAYKVPRRIYFLEEIPRGSTGKPLRLALRASVVDSSQHDPPSNGITRTGEEPAGNKRAGAKGVSQTTPTDVERSLAFVWTRHTQGGDVSCEEDFFMRGGDSLSVVAMFAQLDALLALDVPLPLADFFDHPTFNTLTEIVARTMAGHVVQSPSHALRLIPLRDRREGLPFFMIPADGEEGSAFRRLSKYLDREHSLALIRPESTWYSQSNVSLIETAAEAATLIVSECRGPYFVGGFCYGGVLAFETAYQLEQRGHTAFLVLFDVPTPGRPHLLRQGHVYLRSLVNICPIAWRARSPRPILGQLRKIARRFLWFIIHSIGVLSRVRSSAFPLWRWLREQAETGYFSVAYHPEPVRAPILHFTAQDARDILVVTSRNGWQELGLSGLTTVSLPGEHHELISNGNLPAISKAIRLWVQTLGV